MNFTLEIEKTPELQTLILRATINDDSVIKYGNARKIKTAITIYEDKPFIDLKFELDKKEENLFAEAGHFVFPINLKNSEIRINKLGSVIDPANDIPKNANNGLYCCENWVDISDNKDGMAIIAYDMPLFSIGQKEIYKFKNEYKEEPIIFFNCFNNSWGTNFPKGELGIADDLAKKLLNVGVIGFKEALEVRKMLKMDLFNHWCAGTPTAHLGTDSDGNIIEKDSWGTVFKSTGVSSDVIEPSIKDADMIDTQIFPEIKIYEKNIEIISYFNKKSDLFVFGQTEGIFSSLSNLCGFEGLMMYTCTNEEEIKRLAMKLAEHYAELAKLLIDSGAHGILIADDIAYNTGTFISPAKMRGIIFPALKKEVELIKKYKDVPVFMHTDGDINKVIEDIVDCGFDGLQSLQPSANMDLENIKAMYGEKLCLMGNIDLNQILPFGTEKEVRKNVKQTIDIGNRNGGYILSTCNILTKDIPIKNAIAMYDEAEKYSDFYDGKDKI